MKKRILSLVLALALVMSLLPFAVAADSSKFTDVSKDSWYKTYVDDVVEKGYFKGTSETTFEPELYMTRAMFVTVLARLDGAKVDDTKTVFPDVPVNTWYTGSVTWAAENKIVNGVDGGKFAPDDYITREQMCTIMDRYLTYYAAAHNVTVKTTKNTVVFSDQSAISSWAAAAVASCVSYGLIIGCDDGSFQPAAPATRAQVAAVISRLAVTANAISGGNGGGGSSKTEVAKDDYVALAIQDAVEKLNKSAANMTYKNYVNNKLNGYAKVGFKTEFNPDTVKGDSTTREQSVEFSAGVSCDVLKEIIVKSSVVAGALLGDQADKSTASGYKQWTDSVVDKVLAEVRRVLDIDDLSEATVEELKDAVYAEASAIGSDFWSCFFNAGENNKDACADSVKIYLDDTYYFHVNFEGNRITINPNYAGSTTDKATFAAKFAAAIAKDLYADLKTNTGYTSKVEMAATINATFVGADANYPVNYPYTVKLTLNGGENVEYKFDGASYLKFNVSAAAQNEYKAAVKKVAGEVLSKSTVSDKVVDVVAEMDAFSKIEGILGKFGVSAQDGGDMINAAAAQWTEDNLANGVLDKCLNKNANVTFENRAFYENWVEQDDNGNDVDVICLFDKVADAVVKYLVDNYSTELGWLKYDLTPDDLDDMSSTFGVSLSFGGSYPRTEKYLCWLVCDKLNHRDAGWQYDYDSDKQAEYDAAKVAMKTELNDLIADKFVKALDTATVDYNGTTVSVKTALEKVTAVSTIGNAKNITLENLATLLKSSTFQSYVGSYGNSTIAKVTDYLAKLPANANVTVKVAGKTIVLDKAALADIQDSTGTVDACNALAKLITTSGMDELSLSSFDSDNGALITATAKGRTYGFHLVICFDSNH